MPGIIKYQVCFTKLTKKVQDHDPDFYAKAIIAIRLTELQEETAYMVKCNKANSGGTKITFAPVRSVVKTGVSTSTKPLPSKKLVKI